MKALFIAFLLCFALTVPAWATSTSFQLQTVTDLPFQPTNIGADRTYTVSVTNGSATVLTAQTFPADIVGRTNFTVSINGTLYCVASIPSTGSLTLTTNYSGATGSASMVLYKFVYLRIHADQTFRPAGSSQIVQQSSPGSGLFYAEYAVSVRNVGSGNVAYIQPFTIPATVDSDRPSGTYQFIFYGPTGNKLANYTCPSNKTQLRVPSTVNNFADLCTYNSGSVPPVPDQFYTIPQINTFLPSCTTNQIIYAASSGRAYSCLTVRNGLSVSGGFLDATAVTVPPTLQYLASTLTQRTIINVGGTTIDPDGDSQGIKASDNLVDLRSELTTTGVPTRFYNFITDGNASPDSLTLTTGSISTGTASLVVNSATRWKIGQGIAIAGAGVAGATLITTVNAISGTTFTLNTTASTTVASARVQHDNTAALQAMITRRLNVYIPHGDYSVFGKITLPAGITEGYPLIVRGAGVGTAKLLFHGSGTMFEATAGEAISNFLVEHLTISATQAASPATTDVTNQYGYAFDLTEATVVNNLQLKNLIINGWRGAIACSNCQNGVIEKVIIREYKTVAVGLVGPETIFVSGGESNVTAYRDGLIELGKYVADADVSLMGIAWTSGSKTLTATGTPFVSTDAGKWVRITNAGQTGGDVIALIKSVNSSSSITVSAANNSGGTISGGVGTMYKTNIGSLWLHRASAGEFSNITIQGNWSNAVDGHVTSAVIVENSGNVVFKNLWDEDSGGNGGPSGKLTNTNGIQFISWHSNADPGLWPASHSSLLQLTNAKNTYISGLEDVSSISPFGIDTLSTLFVDNSYLGYAVNTGEAGYRNVTYGDNVVFELAGETSKGTAFREDATYGENFVLNPRYDAAAGAATSWTENIGAALTYTNAGTGRQQRYVTVNRQGAGVSLSVSQTLTQTITVPDDVPPGPFVLGFDWRMEDHGTPRASSSATGGQVYVDVTTSSTGGAGYPNGAAGFRWFNFTGDGTPEDTWFRQNFRLYLGTGTSRTFVVRIFSSAGPSTPSMSFTNWRLLPGKHAPASYDQPITRYQGGIIETATSLVFKDLAGGGSRNLGVDNTGAVVIGSGGGGGSGLTSLTAPSGGAQTGPGISFALGSAPDTDASIAGNANTITFNFPTASAARRGLLSASDFLMLNGKVAGSIANTQIGVGSGTSLSGSSALVYASNLVNNTVSANGTVGFQATNANSGTGANVEVGSYTAASSLRMVATGSGWSTPPGTLYGASSAILDAGSGTNILLFNLNDSGGSPLKSMRWGIGQVERMRLNEDGLCIGCVSPSTKLHVNSGVADDSGLRLQQLGAATVAGTSTYYLGYDSSNGKVIRATTPTVITGTNGQVPIGTGSGYTMATLTATANETKVTNGSGSITLGLADAFSLASKTSTAPMKVGTTLPATCDTGDFFFDSDAVAGNNIYACTDGATDTWTLQSGGGGGSTAWDALTNPASGNTSLSMGARTTTFTWGTTTGSSVNMFTLADGASNTGTGYLLSVNTAASSAAQPFRFTAGGTSNGIEMSVLGVVQKKGTGGIDGSAIITSNSVANSVLDADLAALGNNSTVGFWVGSTNVARTLTGTANQVIVTNGTGGPGDPVFSLPQSIHTSATPQFARLGLGAAASSVTPLTATGATIVNGNSTGAVGGADLSFTVNTDDTATETYHGLQIIGTINTPSPNANKTINILTVNTSNTDVTGSTVNLASFAFNGASQATIKSSGAINATTGFQINNAATSGRYLRGNGTNFVQSLIVSSDVPIGAGLADSGGALVVDTTSAFAPTWAGVHTWTQATSSGTNPIVSMLASTSSSPTSGQARASSAIEWRGAANSGSGATATAFRSFSYVSNSAGDAIWKLQYRNSQVTASWADGLTVDQSGNVAISGSVSATDITGIPIELSAAVNSAIGGSVTVFRYVSSGALTLPASLTGSYVIAGTAATAQADFLVKKNGSTVCTARFAAAGTTASYTSCASPTTFAAGDILTIVAPATPDATLADLSITLRATK